jgi:hypothetical protein
MSDQFIGEKAIAFPYRLKTIEGPLSRGSPKSRIDQSRMLDSQRISSPRSTIAFVGGAEPRHSNERKRTELQSTEAMLLRLMAGEASRQDNERLLPAIRNIRNASSVVEPSCQSRTPSDLPSQYGKLKQGRHLSLSRNGHTQATRALSSFTTLQQSERSSRGTRAHVVTRMRTPTKVVSRSGAKRTSRHCACQKKTAAILRSGTACPQYRVAL